MKRLFIVLFVVMFVNILMFVSLAFAPVFIVRSFYSIKFGYDVKKMIVPKSAVLEYDRNQILSLYNLNDNQDVILGTCIGKVLSTGCSFQLLATIKSIDSLNNIMEVTVGMEDIPIDIGTGTIIDSINSCPRLDLECINRTETFRLSKEDLVSGDLIRLKIVGYKLNKLKAAAVLVSKNEKI